MFKKVTITFLIFLLFFLSWGFLIHSFFGEASLITEETWRGEENLGKINEEIEEESKVSLIISAIGDCALGTEYAQRGHTFASVFAANNYDYGYFFNNVKAVLVEDDLTIANLETCLTKAIVRKNKSYEKSAFWLKGEPCYANVLAQGSIEVVNIANNHAFDYGDEGYLETLTSLKKAGILYYGFEDVLVKEVKGIKIGFLGFNQFSQLGVWQSFASLKENVATSIQALKEQTDLIIVSFHWGNEREIKPSLKQYELAKVAIDSGAELVLGHHPHVLQGIKEYRGKPIVFSLGNFCFGGNRYPYDRDTIIYRETFVFEAGELRERTSTVIPCSLTTRPGLNDFQPNLLKGAEAQRVLDKLEQRSELICFPKSLM